ncbi:hypothetical protein BHE74_00043333, partial [Ensete ventricosum]
MYRLVWRYISVRQVTGMRIARYWAVPSKIDRRRSISAVGGRLKKKSTVDGRLREKSTGWSIEEEKGKKKRKRKKKEGKKEYLARLPSPPAGHLRAVAARGEKDRGD